MIFSCDDKLFEDMQWNCRCSIQELIWGRAIKQGAVYFLFKSRVRGESLAEQMRWYDNDQREKSTANINIALDLN